MNVDPDSPRLDADPDAENAPFDAFGLSADGLKAVRDAGFSEPTPVQRLAIPAVLLGLDVVARAQTGTGKTAAFALPMIDILSKGRARARMPRALVLAPTRELAAQIAESFAVLGKYHPLSMALLIGGVSIEDQEKKLDRGVDVLVATPGRLLDHFERGGLILHGVHILVIDEADRMLDMGFIPDVERIIKLLPTKRQTLMFSATIPAEVRRIADAFTVHPKEISVTPKVAAAENVDHSLIMLSQGDAKSKRAALRRLLDEERIGDALIFCNRKRDVDVLRASLARHGYAAVGALHGDMAQAERTATLQAFREGRVRLLVASDVAGRGLDITELPCVINFDVPHHSEDYVHRIGRTGRAGRAGRAFTLAVTRGDEKALAAIERLLGGPIPRRGASREAPGETAREEASTPSAAERREPDRSRSQGQPAEGQARGRRRRGGRGRDERKAPAKAVPAAEEPSQGRGPAPRGSEPSEPTLGFGNHTPAFLKR